MYTDRSTQYHRPPWAAETLSHPLLSIPRLPSPPHVLASHDSQTPACVVPARKVPFSLLSGGGGGGGPTASGGDDATLAVKALGIVPMAHTCDNVLELPNYWTSVLRAEGITLDAATRLPPEDVSAHPEKNEKYTQYEN